MPGAAPHKTQPLTPKAWLHARQANADRHIRRAWQWGFLSGLATIVQLGLMAWLVHGTLVAARPVSSSLTIMAGIGLAIVVRSTAQTGQDLAALRASDQIRNNLRRALVDHWHEQGPVNLGGTSAATLASEWLDQVEALHGYYARFLPQMWICVLVPLAILVTVLFLDWLAALFLLLSAPLIPLFMALVGMGAEKLNQQHMETLGRLSGFFLDQLRGLTTLQAFGQTDAAVERTRAAADEYRRINMKTLRVAFLSSAVLEFFAAVAIAVVAIYVGFGLLGYIAFGPAPDLTLFSGLFILLLAPEFFQPLRQLSQHYHDRAAALGAAAQLQLRLGNHINDRPNQGQADPSSSTDVQVNRAARVEITDMSASYQGGRPALRHINMTIRPGEFVVVSGPSGSGKTTLLSCLAGFLRPREGAVVIDGRSPGQLAVGWLGQIPMLVQGSWADNLTVLCPEATAEEMMQALDLVGLGKVVRKRPEELDAPLTEEGIGLSGGQARRLALARIFLAGFSLVLLDEPTAGLDPYSEQRVLSALTQLQDRGVTIVATSHHQAVIRQADRHLELKEGQLC